MPGVLVTTSEVARNGVDMICEGVKRRRNWAYLLGYCNKAGKRDGETYNALPACDYTPCKKHMDILSHARVQGRDFGTQLVGACPARYQVTGAP
jgi:hypothetical protein